MGPDIATRRWGGSMKRTAFAPITLIALLYGISAAGDARAAVLPATRSSGAELSPTPRPLCLVFSATHSPTALPVRENA